MHRLIFLSLLTVLWPMSALDALPNDDFVGIVLPPCPRGCLVKIYHPLSFDPKEVPKLPLVDRRRDIVNARPYFESLGVAFPKGGFAWIFPSQSMVVIATTQKNLDLFQELGPIE